MRAADDCPDWIREAIAQTRHELALFLRTAADFALHPSRSGRLWTRPGVRHLNPIGFAATSFAMVGAVVTTSTQLFHWNESSSTVTRELLAWLLPFAYFLLLGMIQHLFLRLFRSSRPLRDSCAMALYAGGGVAMLAQLLAVLVFGTLKRLGRPLSYGLDALSWSWTARFITLFASLSVILFFITLGATQVAGAGRSFSPRERGAPPRGGHRRFLERTGPPSPDPPG